MEVRFRTRRLKRCFERIGLEVREWGPDVGLRYVEGVRIIGRARSFDDLYGLLALALHPLRGDRHGQFALRLTGRMRLIVVEVVDYHG